MTKFFVTGAGGALGSVLMRELVQAHRSVEGMVSPHGPMPFNGDVWSADLAESRTYRERVLALAPKVIVHLGAVARPADAYREPERARKINVESTAVLLSIAEKVGAHFIYASTDLVFDGEEAPYDEDDAPEPPTVYARTKLEAESHVLTYRRGLVLRFPLMYGLPEVSRKPTFFETTLERLRSGQATRLFNDEVRSPLWLDDGARAVLRLAATDVRGVLHLGGPESLSRFEMGERIIAALGVSSSLLESASRAEIESPEPRARDVSLDSSRYTALAGEPPGRPMHEALAQLLSQTPNRSLS
jgi:dTDP-4-dehydrorhamnose reductase